MTEHAVLQNTNVARDDCAMESRPPLRCYDAGGDRAHVRHPSPWDVPPDRGAADAPGCGSGAGRRADRRRGRRRSTRPPNSRGTSRSCSPPTTSSGCRSRRKYGGLGGELLTVCLAIEQISRVCATSGLILAVQELGALPLLLAGSDEQKERWFPDLAAGRTLIAFALTEAEAGSDAAATRTRARRDGDDWVIDGSKRFISQGSVADLITVFAATTDDPEHPAPQAPDLLHRREGHGRLRRRADRAQDGHPRLAHGGAELPRRPRPRLPPRRR